MVDHFKVLRLAGKGGMGEVYLARDSRLGRKVALKVIHPDVLTNEEVRQRFISEARITARFSHPNIVTVHHVGTHDGSSYLAMEYLDGQPLNLRLSSHRPGLKEALRIAHAIADALTEAHRHGVLHRDLKPANILLATDGRLRVLDFGLAKQEVGELADSQVDTLDLEGSVTLPDGVDGKGKGPRGSPHYMAPEQWQERDCSGAVDIWALGLILHQLITGHHPNEGLSIYQLCVNAADPTPFPSIAKASPDLPLAVVELVDACLNKDPDQRPPARKVARGLARALQDDRTGEGRYHNPFRGLLPFDEQHAHQFYGREAEIDAVMERLRVEPVLPVVGPSGAGKSSFIQAGVIPRLREQGHWEVIRLRPGNEPFLNLALRLTAGDSQLEAGPELREAAGRLAQELQEEPGRLALRLLDRAEQTRGHVLLFVDQLEELYTLDSGGEAGARRRFMRALCTAADDAEGPVRVIFTLRDDFLGRVAEGREAREALARVTVLRTPDAPAMEEILRRPVEAAGYHYEDPRLAQEMVAEVQDERAALPMLQFAGHQLWARRDQERLVLTREAYAAIGGVAGALARHADSVIDGLTASQEQVARHLFLRLVTADGTRAVVPRSALLDGLGPDGGEVLERLTRQRVLVARKGLEEPELELAHESLVVTWRRLERWLEEGREERQFLAEVGQAASLWHRRGRHASEVWGGDALAQARVRAARCEALPDQVRDFLEAGLHGEARRKRRRRLLLGAAVLVLTLVAAGAVAAALLVDRQRLQAEDQRSEAVRQRQEAHRQRGAALEAGARAALLRGEALEARASLRGALESGDSLASRALWWRLQKIPLHWKATLNGIVYAIAFSPDGKQVAVVSQDQAIYLLDVATRAARILRGHRDQIFSVSFSPDGKSLASGTWGG